MLQWMGGSRRKVTTSRNSTQKRQKQYFEQRKRQQQQQQMTGLDNIADEIDTCGKDNKKHRSLDILCFMNLSTVNQGSESGFSNAGSPARHQVETASPKKALFSSSERHNDAFNGKDDEQDHCMRATENNLSFLDLLGDDEPCGNSKGSKYEAHVAFSVEGLGKVGTETPAHSPRPPGRNFSRDCSKPSRSSRGVRSSKNLNNILNDFELDVDAMMNDMSVPLVGSSLKLPFYSRASKDSFSNQTHKFSTVIDCEQHNQNDINIFPFDNEEIFYNTRGRKEHTWKESSLPYFKDHKSEIDQDFVTWARYPTVRRGSDFSGVTNQPAWSYVMEDARDSSSLLSEESCSSSAVGKRRHRKDPSKPVDKYAVKDTHAKRDARSGDKVYGSGRFTRMPSWTKSQPDNRNTSFQMDLEQSNSWLYEEEYKPTCIKTCLNTPQISETARASPCCHLWSDDPFCTFCVPKSRDDNDKSSLKRYILDANMGCSPSFSFSSEKVEFYQPMSRDSGPSRQALSHDTEMECITPHSSQDIGSQVDGVCANLPEQESVGIVDENKTTISSENGKPMDVLNFEENHKDGSEVKDESSEEIHIQKSAFSPQLAEKTVPFLEIRKKFDGNIDETRYQHANQTPCPSQNDSEEIEVNDTEERNIVSQSQENNGEPSCQMVMLESYVLQLLCVQKVQKSSQEPK